MLRPHAKLPTSIAIAALLVAAAGSASAQSGYESRTNSLSQIDMADLPPNARPGECYARVYVPPMFRTDSEQILKKEAAERLEIIPARYETITERVMVKPETTRLEQVPAKYENVKETLLVAPARTEWQKGPCDPKRQIDNATGECLCLVEIPPRYKTVTRRVMVTPPSTREVVIPAEYKTVKKQIELSPPAERRIPIAAEYTTVTRQVKTSDAHMKWVPIDCKTRAPLYDRDTTLALQQALKDRGFDPGPVDGIFGSRTRAAMEDFQRTNGIDTGVFDEATRKALKI